MSEIGDNWDMAPLDQAPSSWKISRRDVAWAMKTAKPSAPGPDGFNNKVWQRLGRSAEKALLEVAQNMENEDFASTPQAAHSDRTLDGIHDFNLGLLFCIPKTATFEDPILGSVYAAEATRPISVTDVSNRILASAYKRRWEPIISCWICPSQRDLSQGGRC